MSTKKALKICVCKCDDPLPNQVKALYGHYLRVAMICGSHYACSYTMWCFPDNFFLLSVFGSLEKKKEKGPIMPNLACGRVPSHACMQCVCTCML